MNKKFKTLMTVTLACLMFCGTALAAPRGGRGRAPNHGHRHHDHHHKNAGWITLGAAAVGGLIGGLVGACR